jgi:hypothetical protein
MFKIEENIPIPITSRGKGRELEELRETLIKLKNGQSVFVERTLIGYSSILPIIRALKEDYTDRRFIIKHQKEPIEGVRIWAKFY